MQLLSGSQAVGRVWVALEGRLGTLTDFAG